MYASLGFAPNAFADFGDFNVGNDESFPWPFKPQKLSDRWNTHYGLRVSCVGSEQDSIYDDPDYINTFDEESIILYGEKGWQ